jgi:SPP1 gp7 family putative phage head morphogenesis protein
MNKSYWAVRIQKAQAAIVDKNLKAVEKQLAKYYGQAAERAIKDFESVYDKILLAMEEGREPTPADLYKLDKYWQAQGALRQELQKLGEKQISLLTKYFEINYFEIYYSFALEGYVPFATIDKAAAMQVIKSIWVADGKDYSQRVWDNIGRLTETLNDELIHCVVTGKKTTELKRVLQERFNVSYRRADTLARTELAHIQTESARQRYHDYGIMYVEVLVDEDERTCDECKDLEGQRFPVNAVPPLPLHPNERCCLIPVIED